MLMSTKDSIENVPEAPHQPGQDFKFPKRSFGQKTVVHLRWPFLHYKESTDTVFCHVCLRFFKERTARLSTKADQSFVDSYDL